MSEKDPVRPSDALNAESEKALRTRAVYNLSVDFLAERWPESREIESSDFGKRSMAARGVRMYGDVDDTVGLWRLVVNTCLYMSSQEAELREVKPAVGAKRSPKKVRKILRGRHPFILVGESVPHCGRGADSTYRLGVRFIVRGHWRNQPWGPRKALRRWKWIRPHWKGPDAAEVVNKTYWADKGGDVEESEQG